MHKQFALSDRALDLVAARFRVMGEANRLKLLQALRSGEKSVSDLLRATGLAQANASRHLQTLTEAGILSRRKEGLKVIYSIADQEIFELCDHVCGSVQRRFAQHARLFEE
jgi:ArsR family transcriptional regulator